MKTRSLSSLLFAIFVVISGPGCSGGGTPDTASGPDVLAGFRGGEIHRAEFEAFTLPVVEQDAQVAEAVEADWRIKKIEALAFRRLLEASPAAADTEPAIQAATQAALSSALQAAMTRELGWDAINVTPGEARAQYDAHPEQYFDAEKLQIQHIYLRAAIDEMSEVDRAAVRSRLEEIRQEVLDGADLSQMARKYSESSTARAGGALTVSLSSDIHPEFLDALRNLEIGGITGVIDTPTGFQFAKLTHRIPPVDRKFEDIIKFADRRVRREKLQAAQARFVEEFGPRYGLQKHYELLEDPHTPLEASLITIGETKYTLSDLSGALPEHLIVQLYIGELPDVIAFLDEVALNSVMELEGIERKVIGRAEVKAQFEATLREARFEVARNTYLEERSTGIPEADLREFYEQNEERYQTLKTMDVDVILLKPQGEESLWECKKRAEALTQRLREGEDFAEVARQQSRHFSASRGGRMERLTTYGVGRLLQPRPSFSGMLNNLEEGEISDPVIAECYQPDRLRFLHVGVMIVRLAKRYPPEPASFEVLEDRVRAQYVRRYFQRLADELQRDTLNGADLKVYFDNLPPV